jgi:hypothetical protein
VYLPSNSSQNNSTTEYTTTLAEEVKLPQNCQVALVEVIYKHSWNVTVGYITYSSDSKTTVTKYIDSFHDSETISSLVSRINTCIKDIILLKIYNKRYFDRKEEQKKADEQKLQDSSIEYNFKSDKLYPIYLFEEFREEKIVDEVKTEFEYLNSPEFIIENNILKLKLHENFLGTIQLTGSVVKILEIEEKNFSSKIFKNNKKPIILNSYINPKSPIDIIGQLYIYAPDLIEYQFVGYQKAPLLAIIVVEPNSFNKVIKITLDPPHYLNIIQNSIKNIKISIRDQFGSKILFDDSTITLKLDFKNNG